MARREEEDEMDRLAKAELVREKTGATFEDAREALEACGYDVLDAIVWLEKKGRTAPGGARAASYSTAAPGDDPVSAEMARAQSGYERASRENGFVKGLNRGLEAVKNVLKKSIDVMFVVERKGRQIMTMPVLLLILLLLFAFPLVVLVLIVALFFDVRYHFEGVRPVNVDVNRMSDKVSDSVDAFKRDVMGGEGPADGGAGKDSGR